MEHFATKSHCPHCSFTRCWKIRRNHRKCKRCRREWSASLPLISGCRATRSQWRVFLQAFLWEKTGDRISLVTGIERHRVYRMALIVRRCMTLNRQHFFAGTVEIDETEIHKQENEIDDQISGFSGDEKNNKTNEISKNKDEEKKVKNNNSKETKE